MTDITGAQVNSRGFWKLRMENGETEEFIDIRRKIGNRIIRAYLLDPLLESGKIDTLKASLRGPKDEFQDFDRFIILKASHDGVDFRILAETGVYENIRVVGTDSQEIASKTPDDLEKHFTEALQHFTKWNASVIVSTSTKVKAKSK